MLRLEDGDTLLIHHWDTDGICSAALILEYFEGRNIDNWVPTLGTFYLEYDDIQLAWKYDNVIICDISLPASDVVKIAEKSKVTMIDHHHQEPIKEISHINPVAFGARGDSFPSCTWVLKEYMELPISLKVVLGLVGDREQKIKENNKLWQVLEGFMDEEGYSFEQLLELVYRIDASYKVGNRESVIKAPRLLMRYRNFKDIIQNKEWENYLIKLKEKMETVLTEPPHMIDGLQVKVINTPYAIVSQVTRRIAWNSGKDVVVINKGFFEEDDQFYVRSSSVDMHGLIEIAKDYGYSAGGKTDVLGAVIPKEKTDEFMKETIEYLKKGSS
jgi:hypothetical protein